jgi:RHS repeat-associated protein
VKSTINGVVTTFVGNHYEVSTGKLSKYYFLGGARVAMRQAGLIYYPLTDHLGSTTLTTDGSGAVVSELRYTAWGKTRFTSGSTLTKYQFTGQYSNEPDFGRMYFNARWYDSGITQFTSPDTIIPEPYNSLDYQRYGYARYNPLKYSDPSGHMAWEGDGGGCTNKTNCNNKTIKINNSPISTPKPRINSICNGGPTNGCATATAFNATVVTNSCNTGLSCIVAPTSTHIPEPTPTSEQNSMGGAKQIIDEGIPTSNGILFGEPSLVVPPADYSLYVQSLAHVEQSIRIIGGWGAAKTLITDVLYGDGLITRILQGVTISSGDFFTPLPVIYIQNTFPGFE